MNDPFFFSKADIRQMTNAEKWEHVKLAIARKEDIDKEMGVASQSPTKPKRHDKVWEPKTEQETLFALACLGVVGVPKPAAAETKEE